jgi:hypothetical protein
MNYGSRQNRNSGKPAAIYSPGDKINTPVVVFNNLGQADSISVTMKIDGAARLISKPTVRLYIPVMAKDCQFQF